MTLKSVLALAGGVGMFLYGMNLLGDALSSLAGEKMEALLEKLTNSKLKGTFLGTLITGIIQSSAATCIIVLGFVNAGIMNLSQGIPVIFGANIGSTVTGQILRLGDIQSENVFLTLLKPSSFAPIIIVVGAFILLFGKKKKTKNIAKILIGFGILFQGMSVMEQTMSATLTNNPEFRALMVEFTNPFMCILVGMVLTMIIQSSSASVGILQALTATGTVTFATAVPIIFGQNIGKCLTVWLGAIGTNKKARRAALIHTMFNVIGVIIFGIVMAILKFTCADWSIWGHIMNRGNVADFHSLFNLVTTVILLPFSEALIKFSGKVFKDNDNNTMHRLDILDELFIKNPPIALEQCRKVIANMAITARGNLDIANDLLDKYVIAKHNELNENEHFLDKADTKLNNYLVRISESSLKPSETLAVTEMMHLVGDFERLGDYCVKISNVAEFNAANNIEFSDDAKKELKAVSSATCKIYDMMQKAFKDSDLAVANRIGPLKSVISSMKEVLTENHIKRLQKGNCTVQAGVSFVELLTNYDRIASHCDTIAGYVIQRATNSKKFDTHFRSKLKGKENEISDEYKALLMFYDAKYREILSDDDEKDEDD